MNDYREYRNNLARTILSEADRGKRREILKEAQNTSEYKEAHDLRQVEYLDAQRKEVEIKLSEYAKEHYVEYIVKDDELMQLVDVIVENRREFEEEVLPNPPAEVVEMVMKFAAGQEDTDGEQVEVLLKRVNFDYSRLKDLSEVERYNLLLETVLKAQSYDEAVEENRGQEIEFVGFTSDLDIPDAEEFIQRAFSQNLLEQCLISNIRYLADQVNITLEGVDYMLPVAVYEEWYSRMPEVKQRKFRAESFGLYNTDSDFSKKYIPLPIHFYSFVGENPSEQACLESILDIEKMRIYKLGAISHEIAHYIYHYLMDEDKREIWKGLIDNTEGITEYIKMYKGKTQKYSESFSEAVRLRTTVLDYLAREFPDLNEFLAENFPDIKS